MSITLRRNANYIAVDNTAGNEIGGIYPGASGNTFNLVMFKKDRGNFATLDLATFEAGRIGEREQTQKFANSTEATEFVEQLQKMLQDPRLVQWCAATDHNFDVQSSHPLAAAQHAVNLMVRQLNNAC